MKGQKGFTLVELLVVGAILGVLALIAIPNVVRFIGSGADEAKATEMANVQVAVTSALVEGTLGVCDEYKVEQQLDPAKSSGIDDPAEYLFNKTGYLYSITPEGVITQGDKVP